MLKQIDTNIRSRDWMKDPVNRIMHAKATAEGLAKPEVIAHLSNVRKGKHNALETEFRFGIQSPRWSPIGARVLRNTGYWLVKVASTGMYNKDWKFEHIIVAEQTLGRPLNKGEIVHHINFDKQDNRAGNLYVAASNQKHRLLHHFDPLIGKLLKSGIVKFDGVSGEYYVERG